jgi:hypothetical protein
MHFISVYWAMMTRQDRLCAIEFAARVEAGNWAANLVLTGFRGSSNSLLIEAGLLVDTV